MILMVLLNICTCLDLINGTIVIKASYHSNKDVALVMVAMVVSNMIT